LNNDFAGYLDEKRWQVVSTDARNSNCRPTGLIGLLASKSSTTSMD
jgi:hypothetical protein